MTEYVKSHQRIHATMTNAPTLTRSQIRSKLIWEIIGLAR